jgi:uncharacterized protein (TIGR02118 family)
MVRLIVLYNEPEDRGAFDTHYREVHTPIVERYPRLRQLRVSRLEGVGGRPSAYYLMAEMVFDSRADLEAAISSPAGVESGRDLRNFASAGVALFVASDEADA